MAEKYGKKRKWVEEVDIGERGSKSRIKTCVGRRKKTMEENVDRESRHRRKGEEKKG